MSISIELLARISSYVCRSPVRLRAAKSVDVQRAVRKDSRTSPTLLSKAMESEDTASPDTTLLDPSDIPPMLPSPSHSLLILVVRRARNAEETRQLE